jgi:purine nucleoside phosphorylase
VTAVSQTAGPEAVLCGEAGLPYALLGFATDYANGVNSEPTPVVELTRLMQASVQTFAQVLARALAVIDALGEIAPTGTSLSWP